MTNPDNAVGTNGAFGGRTSVNAFNDILQIFNGRGFLSGWAIKSDSGLSVAVGGDTGVRDVAIAEDANGNRTTVNNISGSPVSVEIAAPPSSGQRIDSIVLYVDNPPQGSDSEIDNPAPCGIIAVQGTGSAAPNGTQIREAITADGASGSTAYYCTIGRVYITSGTTDITQDMIRQTSGFGTKVKADKITADYLNLNPTDTIANGTNLNSMTTIGNYRSTSASVTSTLTNVPNGLTGGFVLRVMAYTSLSSNAQYRRQEIVNGDNTWLRSTSNSGSTWTAWKKVTTTNA